MPDKKADKESIMNGWQTFRFGKKLSRMAAVLLLAALAVCLPQAVQAGEKTKIWLRVGEADIPAFLEDNAATRDFLQMLPLTLTMKDFNGTEKIGDLPHRLSTEGAPGGFEPAAGELAFYAPWGNLAIFYRDYSWSSGLIFLGRIASGLETLAAMPGDFTMTVERAE